MKKRFLTLFILLLFKFTGIAQEKFFFLLRDSHHTLSVCSSDQGLSSYQYTAYGINLRSANDHLFPYVFQGQEYDSQLGVYYFPSRIYQAFSQRFFQPDPKSQYHSPYLFVKGDPINLIDLNGKEGKPLILYQENHDFAGGIEDTVEDLKEAVPDAHYVPMSDFVNGKVDNLEDWNGNVFLKGHMGAYPAEELITETSANSSSFKTNSPFAMTEEDEVLGNIMTFDGEHMGRLLRNFSEERGIPIKNVVAGGCDGSEVAKSLREGFMSVSPSKTGAHPISFSGTKKGKSTMYIGKKSSSKFDRIAFDETKMFVHPRHAEMNYIYEPMENGEQKAISVMRIKNGVGRELPHMNQQQLNEFVNGRIDSKMARYFESFHGIY